MADIKHQIDPKQFGNMKGSSVSHYLVSLLDDLQRGLDKPSHHATICTIDFMKAFDLIDHTKALQKLIQLDVNPAIITVIASFLTQRTQTTRYCGTSSSEQELSCGVPQGTKLGPVIFLIMINDAAETTSKRWKYVDDVTIAEVIHKAEPSHLQSHVDALSAWKEWSKLSSPLQDPSLQALAVYDLPSLLMTAKASSTTKQYLHSWKRWEDWATSKKGVSVFPVQSFHLFLYISHLATTGMKSLADSATAAIKWVHNLAGLHSPTDNPMVKLALQGFKRATSSPTLRKHPITPDILMKIYEKYGHDHASLADLRVLFACFISYAGFLRFDDLKNISNNDLTFTSDRLVIHLASSKKDQFRQGSDVVIARSFKQSCPVRVAERYLAALRDPPGSLLPVLRRLCSSTKGLTPTVHPLSYTRTREIVLDAIKPFVTDISAYGLHSMRSGGATAALNANVSLFLISRHGRWKSTKARNAYLQPDAKSDLIPSQSLGI
ncbi:uncharacterized protein LOC115925113 [Strongylocentrotus purpuratus]|uniref:Reverse transcriptase domain-containing protein n=1 Tax=Strongylocentrotus purpuratus TaxID=7668 RepID=A0A7M7P0C3_STRPU|nr:uncharacterized protein LOC115925113 [Strongylocentrotus purpuratus]